jgi:nucleoside-diphosphate-sugar epimerase
MNKKQNILVNGGAGFIGSHVVHLILDNDYNVTIIKGSTIALPYTIKCRITYGQYI